MDFVIPAKAGIQLFREVLDPGFPRVTLKETFYDTIKLGILA
jgi:hypothetical protein